MNYISNLSEPYITTFFGVEMIIKLIAMGLLAEPGGYWYEKWNRLDAVVTLVSLLTNLPFFDQINISILRLFRVFKTLKNVPGFVKLQTFVITFRQSTGQLCQVFLLLLLCILFFATLGLQIWQGLFQRL